MEVYNNSENQKRSLVKAGNSVLYATPVPNTPAEVAELEAAVGFSGSVKIITNVDGNGLFNTFSSDSAKL